MSKNIGVAAVGDVLDINTWSNTPWYFYKAGRRNGLFNQPWSLDLSKFRLMRYFWNLKQLVSGKGKGGFQYSASFLKMAEAQIPEAFFGSTVISFNQVFPSAASVVNAGGKIYYYIDTTLNDLFNEPEYGITIPSAMKIKALEQERKNYSAAAGVITMGSWSQTSLMDFYQLPLYKIHHILPGANVDLPGDFKPFDNVAGAGITRDFVLGFVGKDWKRKGLPILVSVKDELVRRGYRVVIRVIGNAPEELKTSKGLEYTGFIDKHTDTAKFINELSSCDLGSLMSSTEALGISILEFLRMGVPVMGFYHQGLVDTLMEGASLRIARNSPVEEIASRIENLITHPEILHSMKNRSIEICSEVTWDKTIQKFHQLL